MNKIQEQLFNKFIDNRDEFLRLIDHDVFLSTDSEDVTLTVLAGVADESDEDYSEFFLDADEVMHFMDYPNAHRKMDGTPAWDRQWWTIHDGYSTLCGIYQKSAGNIVHSHNFAGDPALPPCNRCLDVIKRVVPVDDD